MPRPKSKDALLAQSRDNFTKLNQLIDSLSPAGQGAEFPPGTMNRNIRDVLAHLHHWHLMMLDWYIVGMRGDKPEMPAKGYGWKDTPKLNKYIWEKYQGTSLAEARSLLDNSHKKITQLIEKHSDDELFTKKYYKWTGSTSLGAYLISSTSSHYDWALKLIRKAKKDIL